MIVKPQHIPVLSEKIESLGELLVLLKLMSHADESTGISYPSAQNVSNSTGLTLRYVRKCIAKLIAKGLLINIGKCKYNWRLKKRIVYIPCDSTLSLEDTLKKAMTCPTETPYTLSYQDTQTINKQSALNKKKLNKEKVNRNRGIIKTNLTTKNYDEGDI